MRQFKNNYTQRKQLRISRETMERLREPPEPVLVIKIDPVEELLRE
jgi:hypothetical protein